MRRIGHAPRSNVAIMLAVLFLTVFVDLITAVGVGMVVASMMFVQRMSDMQQAHLSSSKHESNHSQLTDEEADFLSTMGEEVAYIHLGGSLSFGAAKHLGRHFRGFDDSKVLILDFSTVTPCWMAALR